MKTLGLKPRTVEMPCPACGSKAQYVVGVSFQCLSPTACRFARPTQPWEVAVYLKNRSALFWSSIETLSEETKEIVAEMRRLEEVR